MDIPQLLELEICSLTKEQVEGLIKRSISKNEYRSYLGKPTKKHRTTPNQRIKRKLANENKPKREFKINEELKANRLTNKFNH